MAVVALRRHGEQPRVDLQAIGYSEHQVLDDWFPATV
jgi:hypothetical protein